MSEESLGSARRRAREVALQVLFAIDLGTDRPRPGTARPRQEGEEGEGGEQGEKGERGERAEADSAAPTAPPPSTPSAEEAFAAVSAHFEMPAAAESFARELVEQVRGHLETLDETISAHARNWRIDRMAAVDRNILRLGTWELRFTDTPAPVILNEAVDLARRFSNDPSPAFVNGILDAVAREVSET